MVVSYTRSCLHDTIQVRMTSSALIQKVINMTKTIGILGGMGPEATAYLFRLIIDLTKVERDQDHIPMIVCNNPQIPDRTAAIKGEGPSPLPALIEGAQLLEKAGAHMILMPCVTAHFFINGIVPHVNIPFLHLLEEAKAHVQTEYPQVKRVGLLASTGTVQSRMFQELFQESGVEILAPDEENQDILMKALYQKEGVKSGFKDYPRQMIFQVLQHLLRRRIEAVIAGCTEIPLVLAQADMDIPFINPLRVVAEKSIRLATRER
jgi:aspartate racemase